MSTISSGLNVLSFADNLTLDEQVATISTQAAIYQKAVEFVGLRHANVNDPSTYRTDVWWDSVRDSINSLGFPWLMGNIDGSSIHREFYPPVNVAEKLREIMQAYIPNFSDDQFQALIRLLNAGQQSEGATDCMNFWNNNWRSNNEFIAVGMGPSWKNTAYDRLETYMTFFYVSYQGGEWPGLFSDNHQQELEVHAGCYHISFYLQQFQDPQARYVIKITLGGSIEDRIRNAPLG